MFTYRIDQTRRLVTVEATGKVSIAEALDVQQRIRIDPAFDPTHALLADYRAADLSDFDAAALRRNAQNTPFLSVSPRAYVASDDLGFGILRMFEIYNEHGKHGLLIKVFRDKCSALQWIGSMRSGIDLSAERDPGALLFNDEQGGASEDCDVTTGADECRARRMALAVPLPALRTC